MKAAIFDMDGLLIDSEPLWREAEIDVFRSIGVPLTEELCRETIGVRLDEVVRHWYAKYPWTGASLEFVESQILESVGRRIVTRGRPMPGVTEAVGLLRAADYALAVASSSPLRLVRTVLETFDLIDNFSVLHSAETEEKGKPHPAVYLSTMSRLEVEPGNCIAFEDSAMGVRAARSAGAWVIAVPDPDDTANPAFSHADVVLPSLSDFSLAHARRS